MYFLGICRKQFSILAGSLRVFLAFAGSRRPLRGGLYTDFAERWSPGILSEPPTPGRSVEET